MFCVIIMRFKTELNIWQSVKSNPCSLFNHYHKQNIPFYHFWNTFIELQNASQWGPLKTLGTQFGTQIGLLMWVLGKNADHGKAKHMAKHTVTKWVIWRWPFEDILFYLLKHFIQKHLSHSNNEMKAQTLFWSYPFVDTFFICIDSFDYHWSLISSLCFQFEGQAIF